MADRPRYIYASGAVIDTKTGTSLSTTDVLRLLNEAAKLPLFVPREGSPGIMETPAK